MSTLELSSMTVIELRKLAKERKIRLGAGLSKDGIIQKIREALEQAETETAPEEKTEVQAEAAETPVEKEVKEVREVKEETDKAAIPEKKAVQEAPSQQPQFKAAWHNPTPRYSPKPAYQAAPYASRPAWQSRNNAPQRPPMNLEPNRINTVRPANYAPRFGPNAVDPAPQVPSPPRQVEEYRPYREVQRTAETPAETPRSMYVERSAGESPFAANAPMGGYAPRPAYANPRRTEGSYYNQELGTSNPAVPEMLAAGECGDGQGVLEIHPEGYGFLRSENFLPSNKDIYISMAQIRRFGLRTGDQITGKTRPQREGDKYAAMLYITAVNGIAPDELGARPSFEELTPIYPRRRVDLEAREGRGSDAMRIADLIAPIGFGQRGLVLCPPETGKTQLLQDFANIVTENYPEVTVMVLLIDECPEDVTLFREQVKCDVLASTFDQAPENHLRLAELVLERAQRLVEQKQDVFLIVDSLTRLAKTYTTSAAQQGRSMPGMVNPTSLFRAKKLFGAARCVKEGGSLTIIGVMNVDNSSKVDDAVAEEFKGTANMELVLDQAVARAGITPPINLQRSGTKRTELLLSEHEQQGLKAVHAILGSTHSATAIPQLLSLMDKAANNDELLQRIQDWVALMEKSR